MQVISWTGQHPKTQQSPQNRFLTGKDETLFPKGPKRSRQGDHSNFEILECCLCRWSPRGGALRRRSLLGDPCILPLQPRNSNYEWSPCQDFGIFWKSVQNWEHRIFQQFITRQNKSRLKLQHRFRLEERWVENSDFKLRFRYFLGLNVPLNNAELVDKTVYLSSYNELFLNHKKTVFDRNRIYGGLGYKLNSRVKFEIGYLNQFVNAGSRDQINLITFLNF